MMDTARLIQAWIVRADMMICAGLPWFLLAISVIIIHILRKAGRRT